MTLFYSNVSVFLSKPVSVEVCGCVAGKLATATYHAIPNVPVAATVLLQDLMKKL